MNEITSMENI